MIAAFPEVFEDYATAVRGAADGFAEAFGTIAGKLALKEVDGLAVDRLGYGNFVHPTLVQPTKNSVLGASRCPPRSCGMHFGNATWENAVESVAASTLSVATSIPHRKDRAARTSLTLTGSTDDGSP